MLSLRKLCFLVFISTLCYAHVLAQDTEDEEDEEEIVIEPEEAAQLEQLRKEMLLEDLELMNFIAKYREYVKRTKMHVFDRQVENLIKQLKRHELIRQHLEKLGSKLKIEDMLKIAILGNSSNTFAYDGINTEVLTTLLQAIKKANPDAVFFLGNLVYGLKEQKVEGEKRLELPVEKSITGQILEKASGYYDPAFFQKELDRFQQIVAQSLGDVPFYPIPGEHEAIGEGSMEIFKNTFKLNDAQILKNAQLAYTVSLEGALFALISTEFYDQKTGKVVRQILPETLNWLDKTLKQDTAKNKFSFVLGSMPAFSTKSAFGIFSGLDHYPDERDRFWKLLLDHEIEAYISSNEVLYDRSQRYGLWQIISGGAGATRDFVGENDETFYHYLLLKIPKDGKGRISVEVFDLDGKRRDAFALNGKDPALFDYRISGQISSEVPSVQE